MTGRLEKMFDNAGYFVEKMYGYGENSLPLRKGALEMIENMLGEMAIILKSNNIDLDKHFGIKDVYKELEYPLLELKKCFNNDIDSHLNKRDSEIFTWYVENKLSELKKMAKEMDQEYF